MLIPKPVKDASIKRHASIPDEHRCEKFSTKYEQTEVKNKLNEYMTWRK